MSDLTHGLSKPVNPRRAKASRRNPPRQRLSSFLPPQRRARRLLRAPRPRHRRAADERDEPAAFHSITSSATASSVGGTSRPRALAVLYQIPLIRTLGPIGAVRWT